MLDRISDLCDIAQYDAVGISTEELAIEVRKWVIAQRREQAAAPDLLAAAEMLASLRSADGGRTFPTHEMCDAADAAIARARGES